MAIMLKLFFRKLRGTVNRQRGDLTSRLIRTALPPRSEAATPHRLTSIFRRFNDRTGSELAIIVEATWRLRRGVNTYPADAG